ncbi:MAG TPA: glycosyltransferase family 4 protein [Thermoanaerobaculia bacterium]|nr:glycosyltransferase family 4 protein [Thermoanaerobaculia bacterium]
MKPPRDLVFVSAGLGLDGGGRAVAGRLLAGACAVFARERSIALHLLTLNGGPSNENSALPALPARDFGGDARALAFHVWKRQLENRREAYVFDLLGPARAQTYLPGFLRAPYLLPLYGIEVWHPLQWDRRRALARATVRFAISHHTLERALPFCPELAGTDVVPLALEDRQAEGTVDVSLVGRVGRGFLLIVGRMDARERYKGHDQLLEALPKLLGLCPNARLVVAGEGNDRRRLEEKAAYLGVGSAVVFAGFTSEATLAELYRSCAVFVMPSRGEGFGLVYLEAMRAARPVLAALGTAAEEIVVQDQTGLLVDPDDRETLARTLARLLHDAGAARRMGWAGRERWEREFGVDRFRQRLEPFLERLVAA